MNIWCSWLPRQFMALSMYINVLPFPCTGSTDVWCRIDRYCKIFFSSVAFRIWLIRGEKCDLYCHSPWYQAYSSALFLDFDNCTFLSVVYDLIKKKTQHLTGFINSFTQSFTQIDKLDISLSYPVTKYSNSYVTGPQEEIQASVGQMFRFKQIFMYIEIHA